MIEPRVAAGLVLTPQALRRLAVGARELDEIRRPQIAPRLEPSQRGLKIQGRTVHRLPHVPGHLSPCREAASANDRAKSSRTRPGEPAVVPLPIAPASSSATLTPQPRNENAQAHPVNPPPTIATVVSRVPLKRRYDGRRAFETRSSQNGT